MRSVVEIVTPAASELLTTLARVKAELQIATGDNDEILEVKIAEASSASSQFQENSPRLTTTQKPLPRSDIL